MSTTSDVAVQNGATADHHVATWTITEDAKTKDVQRIGLVDSTGAEISFTAPSPVTQSGAWNQNVTGWNGREYETVAASATAQALGATGAVGDDIDGLLVIPATTSPGAVTLLDGATSITVFVGGATSVGSLVPFFIPLGMRSVSGAWKVTTGANVSVIGIGNFT